MNSFPQTIKEAFILMTETMRKGSSEETETVQKAEKKIF